MVTLIWINVWFHMLDLLLSFILELKFMHEKIHNLDLNDWWIIIFWKEMSTEVKKKEFICIECFQPVESIYKIYQDGFKDIIQCVNTRFSAVNLLKLINEIIDLFFYG